MIKLTLAEAINSVSSLQLLIEKECSGLLAYKIGKIARSINEEINTFNDSKHVVAERYGKRDENGQLITADDGSVPVPDEAMEDVRREINEIGKTEIELNASFIKLDELANMNLTPQDVIPLIPFIEE